MERKFKLGIIGGGFMSHSIVNGILNNNPSKFDAGNIMVSDISLNSLEKFKKLEVYTTLNNNEVVDFADYIILAIKPQSFKELSIQLKNNAPKKVISIMAGVTKSTIKKAFNSKVLVARCMPNTPISIGYGVVAIDASDFSEVEKSDIYSLFVTSSHIVNIDESKINAATAINGSGPAYVYMFIDALIKSGVNIGLTEIEAKNLALHTVIGGAKMVIANSENSINSLISAVSSKGGTTVAAIKTLIDENFYETINKAVTACKNRAEELSI